MRLGDAERVAEGTPIADASGEPFDAAVGCPPELLLAAKTTAATHSAVASKSASRTCPPLTVPILIRP
jgi:hypothetical protein